MVTPDRCISRSLLKALLEEAVSSSQPLYSIAMSYAMQLALGGAGYRPSEGSPLRPLQAGLVALVNTVNGLAGAWLIGGIHLGLRRVCYLNTQNGWMK
jgi:hypothetical protein